MCAHANEHVEMRGHTQTCGGGGRLSCPLAVQIRGGRTDGWSLVGRDRASFTERNKLAGLGIIIPPPPRVSLLTF